MFRASSPPTPRPAADTASSRGGIAGGAPILAICFLLLVLFLIAATIVLSLIPVYLPAKGRVGDGFTRIYYTRLTPNESLGNDGVLDDNSRIAISRAIAIRLGFPADSASLAPVLLVTSASGKRKRRGLVSSRTRRQGGTQLGYTMTRFLRRRCGRCLPPVLRFFIFLLLFIFGRFRFLSIFVEFILIPIVIPPFLPSTISSTAITASTSTASTASTSTVSTSSRTTAGTGSTGTAGTGSTGTAGTGSTGTAGTGSTGTAGTGSTGTATSESTGTATSESTGTATSGSTGTATSESTGTATSGSTGTATSESTGTATSGSTGTATSESTGTSGTGSTGTGSTGTGSTGTGSTGTGSTGTGSTGTASSESAGTSGTGSTGTTGTESTATATLTGALG